MGPTPKIYIHPWITEHCHMWDADASGEYVKMYYKYPESPDYGVCVIGYTVGDFYVYPVKFVDDVVIHETGGPTPCATEDAVTEHIEKMFLRDQGMEKVYDIEDLKVAPF